MIFVGDLYQLPPIVRHEEEGYFEEHYSSPFFFSSFAYQQLDPQVIELQKIYRQDDQNFKNILNKIRL
jgi:superfamily I DNA and/or RNA helicase